MEPDSKTDLAGRRMLVVMAEGSLAGAIARVAGARGAEVQWIDTTELGWEESLDAREKAVDVLVHLGPPPSERAPMAALRPILREMAERGFGRVVSLAFHSGRPGETERAAALRNELVQACSELWGPGLDLVANRVLLDRVEGLEGREDAGRAQRSAPVDRAATLEEVAEAVTFLASPRAGYLAGITTPLIGGRGLGLTSA